MASQILFDAILNDYYQSVSGSSLIVPPGTNPNDVNIRIVAIVPSSVSSLSAVSGNVVSLTGSDASFTNQDSTPSVTASNCASKKLVIN